MYLKHGDLSKYYVVDIETDGLDATKIWVAIVHNLGTGERHEIYDDHGYHSFLAGLGNDTYWVGHNAISFDIPILNRLWNTGIVLDSVVDTLVLSRLYDVHMEDGHSLAAWGKRLKMEKLDYSDFSKLTPKMVEYCHKDVDITIQLFTKLTDRMVQYGYSEQSAYIEHQARIMMDEQQNNGFYFDTDTATRLLGRLKELQEAHQRRVRDLFPKQLVRVGQYPKRTKQDGTLTARYVRHCQELPKVVDVGEGYETYDWQEFNINSPSQRVEKLLSLGWQPTAFTEKGNPKSGEEEVRAFAEEHQIPEAIAIAEYLVLQGRTSALENWLGYVQPDHRIHGVVSSCGAASRRMTHNSPNQANVPSCDAPYGADMRGCWTATPGQKLVGYDASSLEMITFIHACLSTGQRWPKELIDRYLDDPHTDNSRLLTEDLGIEVTRRTAKTLFYAFLYGAGPKKLGNTVAQGGGIALGKKVKEVLFKTAPGLKTLVRKTTKEWRKNHGRVKLVDGGYNKCPTINSVLNYLCQGNGAVIMKMAGITLRNKIKKEGLDARKVADIHDEAQFDCAPSDADRVGRLAVESLEEAGRILNIKLPITGEYKIGYTWADTH